MKWFYWTLIFLAFFVPIIMIGKGVEHLDIMQDRYKRSLDAGAHAAANSISYNTETKLTDLGTGFGEQELHSNKIDIDKDEALTWFYRVFYRNLGIEDNIIAQENLKKYIPLKAIVSFDKLMIADLGDNWIFEKNYDIEYNGVLYRFTLSEKVMNLNTGVWGIDTEFGISSTEREALINDFIKTNLNTFLNNRENLESGLYYDINIAVSEIDYKTEDIDGINFIVMAEGLPLPTLNPWKHNNYYAFGLGGSEITR